MNCALRRHFFRDDNAKVLHFVNNSRLSYHLEISELSTQTQFQTQNNVLFVMILQKIKPTET